MPKKTFVNNIQKTLYVIIDSNEIEIKAKNKLKNAGYSSIQK
jgi:hypothetical protein